MTFRDTKVHTALAKLATAKLDIDDVANAKARARYGNSAVPSFALLDGDDNIVHRWVGGSDAPGFLAEIQRGLDTHSDPQLRRENRALDQMLAALAADDAGARDESLQALRTVRPDIDLTTALQKCVARAHEREDWQALRTTCKHYLAQPIDAAERQRATLLRDRAIFELTNERSQLLDDHIAAHITTLATPAPGSGVSDRIAALLGKPRKPKPGSVSKWVDDSNAAMAALRQLGRAAVPALMHGLFNNPRASRDCAIVLGSMQRKATQGRMRMVLRGPPLKPWVLPNVIECLGAHKQAQDIPLLCGYMADGHPIAARRAAAWALRDNLHRHPYASNQEVADALAAGLDGRDQHLVFPTLQAMLYVKFPLDLEALIDTLDDERQAVGDTKLGDNALWVLTKQLGMKLVDKDGKSVHTATPAARKHLRQWYAKHKATLKWSPQRWCYEAR